MNKYFQKLGRNKSVKLKLHEISKSFGPVYSNINLTVDRGEILGLLGETAQKTTLMNILTGLYKPDSGKILIDNQLREFHNPREANKNGVGMVHQHFMLVPVFSVTENIILGEEPTKRFNKIDLENAKNKVLKISSEYKLDVDPDQIIEKLPVDTTKSRNYKILFRDAEILIFDEPTAVLTPQEVVEFLK